MPLDEERGDDSLRLLSLDPRVFCCISDGDVLLDDEREDDPLRFISFVSPVPLFVVEVVVMVVDMEVAELLPFMSRASTPMLFPVCNEVLPAEEGDMDEPLVLLESPAPDWVCDCVEVPDEFCAGDVCACTAAVIKHSAAATLEFISLLFI